ncbi:hypothetical protein [Nonomuraea typhae]|uniref:FXSXX-COOH protein n=1 Tax=Nonomuraea typhae TaxID=2603600 RepID=A0ABW7Z5T0_9ACTN|nr:hypothetical protein [Nonomuraea typhae]
MTELPEGTGDERVDAVLAGLDRLPGSPVSDHVAVFDDAFAGLEETLTAMDEQ